MNWRSIDFQGVMTLDRGVVEQLDHYLMEKESRLAHQILNIISLVPDPSDSSSPSLPNPSQSIKLSEVIGKFTKRIRQLTKHDLNQIAHPDANQVIEDINLALWEFTEVLEGGVIELFQQIKQVNVDRWRQSFTHVIHDIKDILLHYIDDLIWAIRRLEDPLKEYWQKGGGSLSQVNQWKKIFQKWRSILDPALLNHLEQSKSLLKSQYTDFHHRYLEYGKLSLKAEVILEKMKNYPVLALLEINDQNLYVDIFRLLKLYELNENKKGTLSSEIVRSLKSLSSVDRAIKVFRHYKIGLEDAFFMSSLELKALSQESSNLEESVTRLKGKVNDYLNELQQLIINMSRYREFILNTNPNPYKRSRWGFTEWIVAPEPYKAKELLHLIYSSEELKVWYERLLISLNRDVLSQEVSERNACQEIDKFLHEMGQPLISQSMIKNRAERLLGQMREYDEAGSMYAGAIRYIQHVLSRAMRLDWKYHVLSGFPVFHEIYHIHKGLSKPIDDPSHAFRMEKFYLLFDQIEGWVRKEDVYLHVHEIELDINDMKIYLQDFLAAIQRLAREKSLNPFLDERVEQFQLELLEYRYIFGDFFHVIMSKNLEGQQLRNQFLFVDQYFESIEALLNELTASWEGNSYRKR